MFNIGVNTRIPNIGISNIPYLPSNISVLVANSNVEVKAKQTRIT